LGPSKKKERESETRKQKQRKEDEGRVAQGSQKWKKRAFPNLKKKAPGQTGWLRRNRGREMGGKTLLKSRRRRNPRRSYLPLIGPPKVY